ncbi:MAG: hypothetical protein K6C99_05765 [Lachnospiraceae bacterium]|nr:hypothetical protein [Lachnospiraceae bacterium]
MKNNNRLSSFSGLTVTAVLMISALSACGKDTPAQPPVIDTETESTTQAPEADAAATEAAATAATEATATEAPADVTDTEAQVGMANPWVEITEDEARELCPRLFTLPDGASVQEWYKCEELADTDANVGPLVQLSFEKGGNNFTARAQYGAKEDDDISGLYVDWTVGPEDVTLANWGEGHMKGKAYRSIDETGYVDLITWYDVEIGIKYSLSVAAADLDGFDLQAVVEQMYCPDNEPYTGE